MKNTSTPASAPKIIESVNVWTKNVAKIATTVTPKTYGLISVLPASLSVYDSRL